MSLNQINRMTAVSSWRRGLLWAIRLSFWFACFLAIIGTVWRPPIASVGLLCIFLVLLILVERISRWLLLKKTAKNLCEKECFDEELIDGSICQQITRSKTMEGLDRLEGNILAEFPADTSTITLHIPFVPAFTSIPKVQAFLIDEADAKIHIFPPKAFGIRVDIKRNSIKIDRLHFAVVAEA